MLTMQQIEDRIIRLTDTMEAETYSYADRARAAAEAESDYRKRKAEVAVMLLQTDERLPANVREARAEHAVRDERHSHLMAQAELHTVRESLLTMRSALEALRTLAATARYQTSH